MRNTGCPEIMKVVNICTVIQVDGPRGIKIYKIWFGEIEAEDIISVMEGAVNRRVMITYQYLLMGQQLNALTPIATSPVNIV